MRKPKDSQRDRHSTQNHIKLTREETKRFPNNFRCCVCCCWFIVQLFCSAKVNQVTYKNVFETGFIDWKMSTVPRQQPHSLDGDCSCKQFQKHRHRNNNKKKRRQQIRRYMGIPTCDATNPNFFLCVLVLLLLFILYYSRAASGTFV